ncbi:MAG TPA: LON peptidase substrate-binding domain-containing protein [Pyrinomonadaceae bacterium]|nr:LON peptidase substrate-binding domain-containing protein [Pyrinomonadaceae bacterium]
MSEALEKTKTVEFLPIFPLPLVLLPGELLPLHIFEPRYREMLSDIEAKDRLFGITLFEPGSDPEERPAEGSVGCVAELREVQPLPEGRSNILTKGLIRYRIEHYHDAGKAYLTAKVHFFEDEDDDQPEVKQGAEEIYLLFERVAKAAFDLSGNRGRFPAVQRTDPERLSFVVTAAFNLENERKYELLELTSTLDRFERLRSILESSVERMEESAATHKAAQTNGHSNRKIDI